jgi:uncharacterized RDD family membrane protein YckC
VAERRWAGSWLSGPAAQDAAEGYPGQRLGLPEEGPRSVASMGRRVLALLIDWVASTMIAVGAVSLHAAPRQGPGGTLDLILRAQQHWTLPIFAVMVYLLTATTGLTLGKRLLGMRVARLDGRPVGFGWALVRTLLLLTVLPPLFTDRDQRGLHDRAANTVVIRT